MKNTSSRSVTETLKRIFERNCMTNRAAANKLGISEVSLSRYLNGQRKIPLGVIRSVCGLFVLTIEEVEILYGVKYTESVDRLDVVKELTEKLDELSEEQVRLIQYVIRGVKS